ncbi:hypothetical protein QZH41_018562, partial [Actinostola sp. cb2023]
ITRFQSLVLNANGSCSTEKRCQFLLSQNRENIFEVKKFSEEQRSWFIEDSVQKDGSVLVTTPLDPIFLCLPYLQNNSQKFRTLDQLLMDDKYPSISQLLSCMNSDTLSSVCDCKGDDDLQAYRLNEDKLTAWLKAKVECVANKLQLSSVIVTKGSQSATFVRSKLQSGVKRDDYLRFASGIVCDYLSLNWSEKLQTALNLPEEQSTLQSSEEPPAKKTKLSNTSEEVIEDYSKEYEKYKSKDSGKMAVKMTAAQKSLTKVNKKGMKSMMSFFGNGIKK